MVPRDPDGLRPPPPPLSPTRISEPAALEPAQPAARAEPQPSTSESTTRSIVQPGHSSMPWLHASCRLLHLQLIPSLPPLTGFSSPYRQTRQVGEALHAPPSRPRALAGSWPLRSGTSRRFPRGGSLSDRGDLVFFARGGTTSMLTAEIRRRMSWTIGILIGRLNDPE